MSDSNENDIVQAAREEAGEAGESANAPPREEGTSVEALIEERDRLKNQLLRTAADFDNFRKRSRRDIEDARRRAQEDVLRAVLPIVDNLERAVEAAGSATAIDQVAEGVRMVLRGFDDVASQVGLKRLEAKGTPFDPNLHDAIQQVETDEHPPGTVVAEVVPGYLLNDKLLRASMVVVSQAPSTPAGASADAPGEGPSED